MFLGDSSRQSEARRDLTVGDWTSIPDLNALPIPDLNEKPFDSEDEEESFETVKNDCLKLLFDFQVEIFARGSCFEDWKINLLNKQLSQMIKSCEIFKVRRERRLVQPYVLMLSSGETCWSMFDKDFKNHRKLPLVPSDYCFYYGDKETISAGTHLIVIAHEIQGQVVWRYELEMHRWVKDTTITPRSMFGSASRGTEAFFAGGFKAGEAGTVRVVNEVDKYNADTKTWTKIKGMNKRRKFSSGCFLHGKLYIIGGRDENDKNLTCGESYDEKTESWTLIPDMIKNLTLMSVQFPPLIAVVNDKLYLLEICLNELWVYNANANTWKKLGTSPVKANMAQGWGVAFKSTGDRLLVIGASSYAKFSNVPMSVYTCRPSPDVEELIWERTNVGCDGLELSHYIRNCCVMFA